MTALMYRGNTKKGGNYIGLGGIGGMEKTVEIVILCAYGSL